MEFKILDNLNDEIVNIRREAFIEGRGVPEELELDGRDSELMHFCLYDGDILLAYLRAERIENYLHIGRVAVKENRRGSGLGKMLMEYLFDYAKAEKLVFIELSAVDTAVGFYVKMGFTTEGNFYLETGVPHIYMKKEL